MSVPKEIPVCCDRCNEVEGATWSWSPSGQANKTIILPQDWEWGVGDRTYCPTCQVAMRALDVLTDKGLRGISKEDKIEFEETVYQAAKKAWEWEEGSDATD